jgi:hypothetical protein
MSVGVTTDQKQTKQIKHFRNAALEWFLNKFVFAVQFQIFGLTKHNSI